MSNYKAIATVTAALRNLLSDVEHGIPAVVQDVKVTTKPLDKTREGLKGNQLNIYLYQFLPNPAWRNMRDPKKGPKGAIGPPPVALDLYYLLTAYGEGDDADKGHLLLGKAMDILNEHPRFPVEELRIALEDSDLYKDTGLITVVPQFLPLEELSKFWTSASTGFRASMVYKVSVILIDNERHQRADLPTYLPPGSTTMPTGADGGWPALFHLTFPNGMDRAAVGDRVTIEGRDLQADQIEVLLEPPGGADPMVVAPETGDPVRFIIPDNPGLPGRYRVWLRLHREDMVQETNALVFALAASIVPDSLTEHRDAENGDRLISLRCQPPVFDGQRIYLLLGERVVLQDAMPEHITDQLTFRLPAIDPGSYYVRLRVDGIDSKLIDFSKNPPQFDEQQRITLS